MIPSVVQTEAQANTRRTYLALMWALAMPGRAQEFPADPEAHGSCMSIARALLDGETSYYTPDRGLARELAQTGARSMAVTAAAYVFLPEIDAEAVADLANVSAGTHMYPDDGATVICGCIVGSSAAKARLLSGPGIPTQRALRLGQVSDAFWETRASLIRYPLGIDLFFVDRGRVVGVPRTTQVI